MKCIDLTPYTVPKVANAILSDFEISLIYGWRDGGKSTSAFRILAWKCLLDKHFRWALCRSKYNEIAGSVFQTMQDEIKAMKLESYFLIKKDRFQIINKHNPNNFFFGASAEQPDKIRSTPNLNGVLMEEAHDCTENDFVSLLGTTRNRKGQETKPKFVFLFNNDKVTEKSFIATTFFDEKGYLYNRSERVHISYEDNPFIEQEATKQKLLNICFGDVVKFNNLTKGLFIKEEIQSPWLYSWQSNRDKIIVDDLPFYDSMPIYISFDFNNDPLSCIVSQHSSGNHNLTANPFIHVLKEYQTPFKGTIQNPFIEIYNHIMRDFNNPKQIFITGDASGFQNIMGLVDGSRHFYDLILKTFNLGEFHLKTPLTNPLHTASRHNYNTIIHYHPMFRISQKGCPNLINDMDIAEATDKNGKGDELLKDRKENKMDLFDASRYYLWTYFNTFK